MQRVLYTESEVSKGVPVEARKNPQSKPEQSIPEAADRASELIRELQSRLLKGSEAGAERPEGSMEDLDQQLLEAFAQQAGKAGLAPPNPTDLRRRVVDGVVDRILREWGWRPEGGANPLEEEVIERLIDRVSSRLRGPKG